MENSKKVIVIGDGVCGKTSLVAKITEGKFINNYHMTVGGKWCEGHLYKAGKV
jgi:GTPase SAR1 family protein